ncbi:MAG: phosphoribosylanthranilate isomerase [Piscirickettsiaceae bacterium]|nr:phosphoribosylanthranilate isomerase [Piscirickettsiaceae bacterium]
MRTRVKICGITNYEDAKCAIDNGVDALGLVFHSASPRFVTVSQAKKIIHNLSPFTNIVALFVDADAMQVYSCLEALSIDILQFHGNESVDYCEQFGKKYLKVIKMRKNVDLISATNIYASASAFLLDSYQLGVPGGTGQIFDWSLIEEINKPIILAGGLNIDNVAMAIERVQPYAVDVSGGIERFKGIKDHQKIRYFMKEVADG